MSRYDTHADTRPNTTESRYFESRLFEVLFRPSPCAVVKIISIAGTRFSCSALLCMHTCLRGFASTSFSIFCVVYHCFIWNMYCNSLAVQNKRKRKYFLIVVVHVVRNFRQFEAMSVPSNSNCRYSAVFNIVGCSTRPLRYWPESFIEPATYHSGFDTSNS